MAKKKESKEKCAEGVPWWSIRLRIRRCHCTDLWLRTFHLLRAFPQKEKEKKRKEKRKEEKRKEKRKEKKEKKRKEKSL